MAERKTFLDQTGLEAYDLLIKEYINKNDTEIKQVADTIKELAEVNKEAIEKLNGDKNTEGSVAKSVNDAIVALVANAPETFDTLKEVADWIAADETGTAALISRVENTEASIEDLNTKTTNLKTYVDDQDTYYFNLIGSISDINIAGLFPVEQSVTQTAAEAINNLNEGEALKLIANQTIADNINITKACYIDANGSTFTGQVTVPANVEVIIANATFVTPVVIVE